jgi:hypothetical protein
MSEKMQANCWARAGRPKPRNTCPWPGSSPEEDRLARQGHAAVDLDPGRFDHLQDLAHGPAGDIGRRKPGDALEGGVDVQER